MLQKQGAYAAAKPRKGEADMVEIIMLNLTAMIFIVSLAQLVIFIIDILKDT